jgi:hypothetical protein
VLILQCREDDIMGLVIQGTDLNQLSPSSKREGINYFKIRTTLFTSK